MKLVNKKSRRSSSNGVGIFTVVGIVFVILKLVNVINWSWWWVTAPFWAPFLAVIVVIILWGIVIGISTVFDHR